MTFTRRPEGRVLDSIDASPAFTTRAIGWYLHLPFCATKCGYCDFYSLPTIPALIEDLVHCLAREMDIRDPHRPAETIFVGGGTPTVMPADALTRLLCDLSRRAGPVDEFTVEANPSSTDELKLELLRGLGVNRISFGAQSFDSRELAVLERLHDPAHVVDSVRHARAAGFDNLNLDLIYAIPGQTLPRWRDNLRRAIDLGPDHLSCYALTYEPGTALTRLRRDGRILPCDEDLEAAMFDCTIDELSAAGFEHYEISNFARPGRRCRSNVIYWENREYIGIGPSAVSYLDGERTKNVPDVRRYVDAMRAERPDVVVERERLGALQSARETAVQMLRLTSGIQIDTFLQRTGFDPRDLFRPQVDSFAALGLLAANRASIRLTRRGLLVANRVMEAFLDAAPAAS